MVIPDINLLVYAYNADAPAHDVAKAWWEGLLNSDQQVGLPWVVMLGYVRLMTYARVVVNPLSTDEALGHIQSWLAMPGAQAIEPGPDHLVIFSRLSSEVGGTHSLVTDIHLAAIALEYGAELHSNDVDFGRFKDLAWVNPIA